MYTAHTRQSVQALRPDKLHIEHHRLVEPRTSSEVEAAVREAVAQIVERADLWVPHVRLIVLTPDVVAESERWHADIEQPWRHRPFPDHDTEQDQNAGVSLVWGDPDSADGVVLFDARVAEDLVVGDDEMRTRAMVLLARVLAESSDSYQRFIYKWHDPSCQLPEHRWDAVCATLAETLWGAYAAGLGGVRAVPHTASDIETDAAEAIEGFVRWLRICRQNLYLRQFHPRPNTKSPQRLWAHAMMALDYSVRWLGLALGIVAVRHEEHLPAVLARATDFDPKLVPILRDALDALIDISNCHYQDWPESTIFDRLELSIDEIVAAVGPGGSRAALDVCSAPG